MESLEVIKKLENSIFESEVLLQKSFYTIAFLKINNFLSKADLFADTKEKKKILQQLWKKFQKNIPFLETLDANALMLIIKETNEHGPKNILETIDQVRTESQKSQTNNLHSSSPNNPH